MGVYAGAIKRVDKDRQGGWIDRGCIFDGDWRREQVTFDVRVEQIDCAFPLEEGAVVSFDLEEFQEGQEAVLTTKAVRVVNYPCMKQLELHAGATEINNPTVPFR